MRRHAIAAPTNTSQMNTGTDNVSVHGRDNEKKRSTTWAISATNRVLISTNATISSSPSRSPPGWAGSISMVHCTALMRS